MVDNQPSKYVNEWVTNLRICSLCLMLNNSSIILALVHRRLSQVLCVSMPPSVYSGREQLAPGTNGQTHAGRSLADYGDHITEPGVGVRDHDTEKIGLMHASLYSV